VHGGMKEIANALARLGVQRGVKARYGQRCQKILTQSGRVTGVQLDTGEVIEAPYVVFNGDVNALADSLNQNRNQSRSPPKNQNLERQKRSLSAFTWSLHAKASGFPLVRHNVFFNQDYRREFDDIFQRRQLPSQGTVYVCAQDRTDHGLAHDDQQDPKNQLTIRERLFCLVNAPADGDVHSFSSSEIQACESSSLALMRRCGLDIQFEAHQVVRTLPQDFAGLFPASGGALYGQATHGWMSAFARPSARSPVTGLYTAGGSVHPGPGVPMAAMSGRLAAATLMADLGLTKRSHRVVISGGTSTR